jgi:ADP-ribose pyrophosphatase
MKRTDRLGPPPTIAIDLVDDQTASSRPDVGFLRVRRLSLKNRYPDGTESRAYRYDLVERTALDAVVVALHALSGGARAVLLRSALRPPLAFRAELAIPLDEPAAPPVLWELPAGLVEPDERGVDGLRACAARETLEETGFAVAAASFAPLGPPACLTPGVIAEKVHFLAAELDTDLRSEPTLDGSAVEEHAECVLVPLAEALAACRDGRIADVKTEIALRRLAELLGAGR